MCRVATLAALAVAGPVAVAFALGGSLGSGDPGSNYAVSRVLASGGPVSSSEDSTGGISATAASAEASEPRSVAPIAPTAEPPSARPAGAAGPAPLGTTYFDRQAFHQALSATYEQSLQISGAVALIVPHHWVAARLIVAPLSSLGTRSVVERIVLVGPDHRNIAPAPAATSDRPWSTPCALVYSDPAAVARLTATGFARQQSTLVADEHSVAGLVPAIGCLVPGATVIPIAVRNDIRPGEARTLGRVIADLANSSTVIVLSADFSHGLLAHQASDHDETTVAVLHELDSEAARTLDSSYVDARGALQVVFAALRRSGADEFTLETRSDSSTESGVAGGPVTSYVVGYYR